MLHALLKIGITTCKYGQGAKVTEKLGAHTLFVRYATENPRTLPRAIKWNVHTTCQCQIARRTPRLLATSCHRGQSTAVFAIPAKELGSSAKIIHYLALPSIVQIPKLRLLSDPVSRANEALFLEFYLDRLYEHLISSRQGSRVPCYISDKRSVSTKLLCYFSSLAILACSCTYFQ